MRSLLGLVAAACSLLGQDAQDPPVLFRERVNLVTVPVVVRDRQGRPVGNLKQEDFQLFDRGKPQTISRFIVEKTLTPVAEEKTPFAPPVEPKAPPPIDVPERYVAYLFDDLHSEFGDLARVRDAAWQHMQDSLRPADRAAIFTTSGQNIVDFTDDRDLLHKTLLKMMPRPTYNRGYNDCPDMGHYQADLIINRMDRSAFDVAVTETMRCANVTDRRIAESLARGAAQRVMSMGEQGSRIALSVVRDVVRRMSAVPGQRVVLLASPGFVLGQENMLRGDVIDRAIKASVTINGLDARGLWVDSTFDASKPFFFGGAGGNVKAQIEREAQRMSSDIVAELAYGTGGNFFQNSNDLAGGFRKLAEVPEYVYMLGFSPENLKMDGSFHALKVSVKSEEKLTASARRGYYAPKQIATAEESAKEEIREAVFSRQEARSFPLEITTSGDRGADGKSQLALEVKVPLQPLRYRVVDGRHLNTLTVVHAVFNHNGVYVAGEENTVDLKLQPKTLESPTAVMNARKTYLISPGVYSVRIVVRDAEDRNLSTANATVEVR